MQKGRLAVLMEMMGMNIASRLAARSLELVRWDALEALKRMKESVAAMNLAAK